MGFEWAIPAPAVSFLEFGKVSDAGDFESWRQTGSVRHLNHGDFAAVSVRVGARMRCVCEHGLGRPG